MREKKRAAKKLPLTPGLLAAAVMLTGKGSAVAGMLGAYLATKLRLDPNGNFTLEEP